MRNNFLVLSLVVFLVVGVSSSAWSQNNDDVYVDMSALDALSSDDSFVNDAQPMFPQIKMGKTKPLQSAKKDSVKSSKAKTKSSKVSKVSKAPKVSVAAKVVVDAPKAAKLPDDSIFKAAPAEVKDRVAAAPIAPVSSKVEMNNVAAAPLIDLREPKVEEQVETSSDSDWVEVVDVEPASPNIMNNGTASLVPEVVTLTENVAKAQENVATRETAIVAPAPTMAPTTTTTAPAPTELLVENVVTSAPTPVPAPAPAPVVLNSELSRQIVYQDGISELTLVQQQQIDKIVKTFENANLNKIAIFAYNLDDGKDVFKKKRLSLNRAVDVRSYLLQKGYKNFSIKVINVDGQSDKINVVEIQELK